MVLQSKSMIKGQVSATVITLNAKGLALMGVLRAKYKDAPFRGKHDLEYIVSRQKIVDLYGHQKLRTTWNLRVLWVMFQCAVRGKWNEVSKVWRYEYAISHNIVTDQGDALIADQMCETPTQTKVDETDGHIEVGTGWTGTTPKQNEVCNTSVAVEVMDATYPKLKGAFGAANDNITQYRAVFEAGEAEATDLDEAALLNNLTPASADCLAYAQIDPTVTVGASDTLQVDWELTFLGA